MMRSIEEQFKRCQFIFVQNKILIPILITLIATVIVGSFAFGNQIGELKTNLQTVNENTVILKKIQVSLDSLLRR